MAWQTCEIYQFQTVMNLGAVECNSYATITYGPLLYAGRYCFSNLVVSFLMYCISIQALKRNGLEGLLAKFGINVGLVRFANVPER